MNKVLFSRKVLSLVFSLFLIISLKAQCPERIISLAPSITKNLLLLGLEQKIVGVTSWCDLNKKISIPVVASAVDANLEKIISLQPDLVFATSLNKPETLKALRNMGVTVEYFPYPKSLSQIEDQFLKIATLTSSSAKAKTILKEEKEKREKLSMLIDPKMKVRVFMQIGTNPLWCAIQNTFLDDFITLAGCENITKDLTNGAVSRESVLIRNPDVIIIVMMGNVGEEEVRIWNSYSHLNAVKKNKIFVLDSDKACSPTPIDFTETLKQIILNIYK